ncbi:hypothetical protein [Lentzea flaviverrucosa]|uniref:Uncharacterized protein n=1 Tax=Lentzea flaviverrucosa TaxID=200379 RepID=A0A1H9ESN4_9PSEU|nr:hypothetical protein [Lentzea flaviverrucosa]RDI35407.1 hypothetical protein DFR72_1011158 [Lentzea flaviverrucosa]SEQ28645.1 hypothetical protein SAMN05216195_10259 [Lentzea flaviverrucosa]
MIPTKSGVAVDELAERAARLARGIRLASKFSDILSWWAGYPLRRVPVEADRLDTLDEHEGMLFGLPAGTEVLRRNGIFVPLHGDGPALASIKSLIYVPRLGLTPEQLVLLRDGAVPVGSLVPDAPRGTHYAIEVDGPREPGDAAIVSRGILFPGGMPAVLADEVVFWRVLHDRAPQRGALFSRPASASVPVW